MRVPVSSRRRRSVPLFHTSFHPSVRQLPSDGIRRLSENFRSVMKTSRLSKIIGGAVAAAAIVFAPEASAQYTSAANQLVNVLSPILSGSGAYKGSVEVMGVAGIGANRLNHVEISTSQGYQYTPWFYMGAGIGLDLVRSENDIDERYENDGTLDPGYYYPGSPRYGKKETGIMLPVFTDFRFDIAFGNNPGSSALFIDLRLGASWLLGNRYMPTENSWLRTNTQFYFRPSIGMRIPTSSQNPKQALNIGFSYLLLTSDNAYNWSYDSPTFSAIGVGVSFEW